MCTQKAYIFSLCAQLHNFLQLFGCSLPGSSVHGISQARILETVDISSSRGYLGPRNQTWILGITGRSVTQWAIGEAHLVSGPLQKSLPAADLDLGEGNGNPLQYSCLENPMDRGAWWAAVHGVAKSRTRLSDFTFTFHFHAVEKEMATHSCILAWRIPGTGEPVGLPSVGSHRVRHDWRDLAAADLDLQLGRDRIPTMEHPLYNRT